MTWSEWLPPVTAIAACLCLIWLAHQHYKLTEQLRETQAALDGLRYRLDIKTGEISRLTAAARTAGDKR